VKAFKFSIPVVALLLAGCGGGAGSNIVPTSSLTPGSALGGGVTTAAKTNTNGNGVGNGCGNAGKDSGKGNGGQDNGNGNGKCDPSPSPNPSPTVQPVDPTPAPTATPFTSGTLNFSQDCTANFSVGAGGVVDETNRTTTGSNATVCPQLDTNIEFEPGSDQPCPSSVSNWGALVAHENWTVFLNPGAAPIGDDELQAIFAANANYTACHYASTAPPTPAPVVQTTSWTALAFAGTGCTADFSLQSNGNVVETNRSAACGLSNDNATFVAAGNPPCTASGEPSGSYDPSGDPTLQAANGGPFAPGSYTFCFYPNT